METVYTLRNKVLGAEHTDTISALIALAVSMGKLGEHRGAVPLYQKAYELCCKVLGSKAPDTITVLNNLGVTLVNLGEYREAETLLEQVYSLRMEVLGTGHVYTQKTKKDLSLTRERLEVQRSDRRSRKVCQHCGGAFTGVFRKKCSLCGKQKDY